MASGYGMGRPPLGSVRVRAPETFECELTRKLQELEGRKKPSNDAAAGKTDSLMLRRRPRPLGNVEAMLEHGEELEGLSRALSWWDLPEDERMARVWPGEEENGDGLDSPFSLQSGQTTPGGMTPPLEGDGQLRPWTLSFIPPEELRLPGYAYEGAQTSPASSAGPSREATPRGPTSRNLFFGNDPPAAGQRGDAASSTSFTAHLAGLRKANEAKSEALSSSLRRTQTLKDFQAGGEQDADAGAFSDIHLTPARGSAPQRLDEQRAPLGKSSSLNAPSTSGRAGPPSGSNGLHIGKENARPAGHETSFNPSSLNSRPCTPPLRTVVDEYARAPPQPSAAPPPAPRRQIGSPDSAASSASDLGSCAGLRTGSTCSLSPQSSCSTLYATPQYTRRKPGSAEYRSPPSNGSSGRGSSRRSGGSGGGASKEIVEASSAGKGFSRACALFGLPSCRTEDRKGAKGSSRESILSTPPATPDISRFKAGGSRVSPGTPGTPSPQKKAFGSFSLSSPGSTPGAGGSTPGDKEVGRASPLASLLGSPAWLVYSPGTIQKLDGKKKTRFSCGGIVVLC